MITSGLVVTGLGITFVIKSAKDKPNEPKTSQLMIQPWFPQADPKAIRTDGFVKGADDVHHP